MALLIFYLLLAILFSFLCSILEAVILSITPSFVESISETRPKVSLTLSQLKDDIDRPLAAILTLNTIAHTVGAAGVGAQAAVVFANVSVGVISGVLTLIILVFSEIIPKTLGAVYYRQLAGFTAKMLTALIWVLCPLVWLSKLITRLIAPNKSGMAVSREELSAMADIGHKEGVFEESELRVIKNMIAFQNIQVRDIMTPRTVVVAAQENLSVQNIYENKDFLRFSRIPIYSTNRDNVVGYIHKHDVLEELARDRHELSVKDIMRDILLVPYDITIPQLFDKMMASREQIALAVDDYGGMAGVVTMEDVLETLLGVEIVDEFDGEHDMQEYARNKWRVRAQAHGLAIEGLNEVSSNKNTDRYATPGGVRVEKRSATDSPPPPPKPE
jgi:CBS domain containing-hemolysin-like protein